MRTSIIVIVLLLLSSCGGGGSGGSAEMHTLSGTVSGLLGTGLVIQNNGGDDIAITANGSFSFPTQVAEQGSYYVTILSQPTNPDQTCLIGNGSGIIEGAWLFALNLRVTCNPWTWVSGSNTNFDGEYGIKGVPDTANVPSGREYAVSWPDTNDNLWLFGGFGYDNNNDSGVFNDLWKFDSTSGNWIWISGSQFVNEVGVYGTRGVASAANVPGARQGSVTWTDSSGNLWLFGGDKNSSLYNDLWKFDGSNWAWISGSNTTGQKGTYGSQGVASISNVPGARGRTVSWIDVNNKLWLFGGYGKDSAGVTGSLNDLWKFDPVTTAWTWVSGSDVVNQVGVYGTKGVADAANVPGARSAAVAWADSLGNFWLFGGSFRNDLWKFDGTSWTWISGSDQLSQKGNYGTIGVAASSNMPGGRSDAVSWVDADNNLWLYGGHGFGVSTASYFLGDLWKFDGTNWTWTSGEYDQTNRGWYDIEGLTSALSHPGARAYATSWVDSNGKFWLMGGRTYTYAQTNDLWVHEPLYYAP